jgi:hypothetical protein
VLRSPRFGRLTHLAVKGAVALKTNRYNRALALVRKLGLRRWFLGDAPFAAPALDSEFADELRMRMRPEVEALEEVLKTDLSIWKPNSALVTWYPARPAAMDCQDARESVLRIGVVR